MQRTFLKRYLPNILLLAAWMSLPFIGSAAHAQSVADIARENQEKKAAQDAAGSKPTRVITNQDLGEGPEGRPDLHVTRPTREWASNRSGENRGGQSMPDQRAEQWRRQIEEQKARIADLQARLDHVNASLHPAGGAQYSGPYTRSQALQVERADNLQRQLDEQQRKLATMQESARRAGMHTAVYDP